MEKPGLLDWVIAPLTWIERTKGPKRVGLLLLYALILLVGVLVGWRGFSLWGLPDIGEPFDVAQYETVDVPNAVNAMVLYRQAKEKLIPPVPSNYHVSTSKAWESHDWATADPEIQRWVVDNRSAFALWLQGAERPDSLFRQPGDSGMPTTHEPLISIQTFARLARLEASRLEGEGDLEGAWKVHRAALRSSRHAGMHGGLMQRSIGYNILSLVRPDVLRWADDPKVTPDLLRRAIADVEVCKAMTSPISEMFRVDYFELRSVIDLTGGSPHDRVDAAIGEKEWYQQLAPVSQIRHFLRREPERTHRVHRLITADILAQCDRPRGERPKIASSRYMIYEIDPRTPSAVAAMKPDELAGWADRSLYSTITGDFGFQYARIELESTIFDSFLFQMAERAYQIEHGQAPTTYGDLLGSYLKALPEGFEPGDSVATTAIPN